MAPTNIDLKIDQIHQSLEEVKSYCLYVTDRISKNI
jgi:hypothetical protein